MKEYPSSGVSQQVSFLAEYIAGTLDRELPPEVAAETKHHVLDTLAAILSGSRLRAGRLAAAYVGPIGGAPEATVIGTSLAVPVVNAALANGMAGHADETDDSHLAGRFHPGCGIVPAALAIAERQDCSGTDLLRAVTLGYDIGARVTIALGLRKPDTSRHSTHSLGPAFGAAAAAAALLRLDPTQVRHVLSYSAQQASGIPFWQRDREHVEKAFDFGGMGARNGVAAATMVAAGFSAVDDPLSGKHNLFTAFGEDPDPSLLTADLGARFEIMRASIKKWCVGSPIQAVLDAMTALVETYRLSAQDARRIIITMPDDRIHIVDNRTMPDVCVQHLAALALVDGTVTFESSHDHERMNDPVIQSVRRLIELVPSAELTAAVPARQAIVEVETLDGRRLRHHAQAVRGTPENPMDRGEIEAKALDLIIPIIGSDRAKAMVEAVTHLEDVQRIRNLRELLTV
ncbi:MmgE/PrpD family protein [Microvirga makkahensis]|uniref:MmgE/PrpD family protein n=1 Tax=Microvirga makkahensis TaxID=1128670 RepID=A0A7X3MW97_9HYPH|nr:MmgE/PrpD family protein [Microvirga makkahensis]MXQ14364.1 MmgE/PrpD family protein [Microvirga makkahensis]